MRIALCVAAVLAASALSSGVSGRLIHVKRSFFGVVRVTHDSERKVHRLFHGTTLHGQQSLDPASRESPRPTLPDRARWAGCSSGLVRSWNRPSRDVAILGFRSRHAGELRSGAPAVEFL